MSAPPVNRPSRNGGWSIDSLSRFSVRPLVSATMIEKIIVVAPTTAVPMSTGLAVALNVLPAPSFSSSRSFERSNCGVNPNSRCSSAAMFGSCSISDNSKIDCALSVTGPYESTAIVTGPMPRNPNATRPNANTAGATISASMPRLATHAPMAMRPMVTMCNQYALKLPATRPDRMLSDAPPSLDELTISRVWIDSTDVNTFTSSGISAPPNVPHVITVEIFHHIVPSPNVGSSSYETRYVSAIDTIDVNHTSDVSGASKFILSAATYRAFATHPLIRYDAPLATIMTTRITKIHTRSCTCTVGSFTASTMNVIRATPVTPYVSKPSALGPTESPALSPVQSAITPGLRASSSLMLNTIFIKSDPMSAILVKMPPAIRSAAAPNDSPMANPMKHGPA